MLAHPFLVCTGFMVFVLEARSPMGKETVFARIGDREVLFRGKSITWRDEEAGKILVPGGPNTMQNNQPATAFFPVAD